LRKRIGCVGFIITPESIAIELDRIRSVADWPVSDSHCNIQVFLGFGNFYRRFIQKFSEIGKTLSNMLKVSKAGKFSAVFSPTPEIIDALRCLQHAFSEAPVLIHFDPDKLIRLEIDSSAFVLAGIFLQLVDSDWDQAATLAAPSRGKPSLRNWQPVAF
jgi:hypothetical protein